MAEGPWRHEKRGQRGRGQQHRAGRGRSARRDTGQAQDHAQDRDHSRGGGRGAARRRRRCVYDARGGAPAESEAAAEGHGGGGGGEAHAKGGGEEGEGGEGAHEPFDVPPIMVNLRSADGAPHFLKVHVMLLPGPKATEESLKAKLPLVLDAYQPFLRELRPEDLAGSAAVFRIKEELLLRTREAVGEGEVAGVLIQDLIQQ
ncbi:flagellar basal body-associated FliL family protein [Sphingomonas aerolata]|uniref:flagellar basal body-associated FliL family protein n=1 Tax=Sphingomonas aerolata TaxID=185951 RepID=UPI002FDF1AD9